ncbi:MAG: GNAT family N-acetyltransferase [Actinomadura sp.]
MAVSESDAMMTRIGHGITLGHGGDRAAARRLFAELWGEIGTTGDPLYRCALAHAMADVQDDPGEELRWDLRALEAAELVTDERARQAGVAGPASGFAPSLHLNLGDVYRRLGDIDRARDHLERGQAAVGVLADDEYGQMIRNRLERLAGRLEDDRRQAERGPADSSIFLETSRLRLRRLTAADEDDLVELDGDPEVMRFLTGGRPTAREEIRRRVLPAFLGYYKRFDGFGFWAAEEKATGRFLGWFHFRPRLDEPRDGEIELGYRLRRSAWGKGYATEGSRALIRKGFTELGVERVFAETMAVNLGSRRVMEKCGLTLVRTFDLDLPDAIEGAEHGEVEYALTRADWKAAAAPRSP